MHHKVPMSSEEEDTCHMSFYERIKKENIYIYHHYLYIYSTSRTLIYINDERIKTEFLFSHHYEYL